MTAKDTRHTASRRIGIDCCYLHIQLHDLQLMDSTIFKTSKSIETIETLFTVPINQDIGKAGWRNCFLHTR